MRSLAITAMAQTVNAAARPVATAMDHLSNRLDIMAKIASAKNSRHDG
jgi:hypothetical protein